MKQFFKKLFVTALFTGYTPIMPGTAGSLVGILIFILLSPLPIYYYIAIVILFLLGVKYSFWAEKYFKMTDPKYVVIDEVVGMMVTMAGFRFSDYKIVIIGFIFFRLFDIIKPFPVKNAEKISGGWGIMADDVIAGVYANIILRLLSMLKY